MIRDIDHREMPETVTLFSAGLLSKWGFHDGDQLDWVRDHGYVPHDVLIAVIRQKLVPALDQKVMVAEIDTAHNPIRAEMVDGVHVAPLWYASSIDAIRPRLTPDHIDLTGREILVIAASL